MARAASPRRVPPRSGRLRGPTSSPVTIHWDRWGVAHVRGAATGDVFVGLGYAMAQERLWQLDYMRRQARGELAAILGPSALGHDRALRAIGIGPTAERDAAHLPRDVAEALDGLTAGINLWTERVRALPIEFDLLGYRPTPWRPADSIAIWKYRWWRLTGRLENVALAEAARRLLPPELEAAFMATELGEETIVPDAGSAAAGGREGEAAAALADAALAATPPGTLTGSDSGEGSNNWVVGPSKSTTGQPILCTDPHQPFAVPGEWFEAQLTGPGLDAIGAIYVGTPGIYLGRNRRVAWGVTNHVAPARDVYLEAPGAAVPDREEQIEVAGAASERIVVRKTPRGPVISDVAGLLPEVPGAEGATLSLAWVGHRLGTGFDAMLALQRARDAGEVLSALALWPCPPLNFVYADADGRIGYHVAAHVPIRERGGRGFRRGDDPADAWQGDLPFDRLPRLADPPRGWVATANNPPWASTDRHYVSLAAWSDGYRMRRIRERLTAAEKLSPAEVADVQADVHSIRARDLTPALLGRLAGSARADVRRAARYLEGWRFEFATDSVAASLFAAFWDAWRAEIARARFSERLASLAVPQCGALGRRILLGDDPGWFTDRQVDHHVERAFVHGLERLTRLAGPRPALWRWGRLHTIEQRHPLAGRPGAPKLNVGPRPTGGGATVRAAGYAEHGPFHVVGGSIYRMVVDFSQPGLARATTSLGQSGHPSSRHYRDQTALWLADSYKPLWMDEADVLANLEGTTVLAPRGRAGRFSRALNVSEH
jgi:penicillin amidase